MKELMGLKLYLVRINFGLTMLKLFRYSEFKINDVKLIH